MYYKIKRILVPLDFSAQDDRILQFLSMICRIVDVKEIYFLHIIPKEDWTSAYKNKADRNLEEILMDSIEQSVERYFKDQQSRIHFRIKKGNKAETIVQYAKTKMVDLIAIGKKERQNTPMMEEEEDKPKVFPEFAQEIELLPSGIRGSMDTSGYLVRKVANMAPCSMLIIPETLPEKIDHVIVPVDFTDASRLALEKAYEIAFQSANKPIIDCVHVFSAPIGNYSVGIPYDEWVETIRKNRKKEFEQFLKKSRIPERDAVQCKFLLDNEGNPAEIISDYAQKIKASAICIGTEGKSFLASLILGDVAERLINYPFSKPLFIIKDKTKNMGFFDALLKL
ncbi:universal stress protein [Persicobacter diffluens]|uniref:UspA domain-containing protein n=1 Tax=Persicobacter diffluens TaxID=981 RepID=A0AAN4VXI3_9BACT|nr:hypothetical protein PEDI_16210 [Persicobacter diffluens]